MIQVTWFWLPGYRHHPAEGCPHSKVTLTVVIAPSDNGTKSAHCGSVGGCPCAFSCIIFCLLDDRHGTSQGRQRETAARTCPGMRIPASTRRKSAGRLSKETVSRRRRIVANRRPPPECRFPGLPRQRGPCGNLTALLPGGGVFMANGSAPAVTKVRAPGHAFRRILL
jgi:hypothetical protein